LGDIVNRSVPPEEPSDVQTHFPLVLSDNLLKRRQMWPLVIWPVGSRFVASRFVASRFVASRFVCSRFVCSGMASGWMPPFR
jgi:hypothetical protein